MASISKGKTFAADETVTNTKLHQLVDNATISGIDTADISDNSITTAKIANNTILPADIDLSQVFAWTGNNTHAGTEDFNAALTAQKITLDANYGLHLTEGTAPSTAASEGALYTKDTSGQPELFYREESDGDEVQITSGGALYQSGVILQVVNTQDGAVATGTTAIPYDDSIPQITEGDQYMTRAITPTSASNYLKIDVVWQGSTSQIDLCVALFQDATANALACAWAGSNDTGQGTTIVFTYYMLAGTTSSTTFSVRAGNGTGATTTFNGASTRKYGGVLSSSITISEIKA